MSVRPVWRQLMLGYRYAGAIGFCLVLILALGRGAAQDASAAGGMAPVTGFAAGAPAATEAALRERIASFGWVRVQVDLVLPGDPTVPRDEAAEALWQADLDQSAQDLLSALPVGSYDTVLRVPGAPRLTLRVDAAGLDALLASPLVAAVSAARNADMQRIAAVDQNSLAIETDGRLWAWGYNMYGQLGDGTTVSRLLPVAVLTGVAAVAGGNAHTLALKTDGSLWAWGDNCCGQLGDGTTTSSLTPVPILTGVAAVAAGNTHTLALKTDGSLWAWGRNWLGRLGDGTTTDRLRPVQILTGVAAVAAGDFHTLALKSDGSLWAWGSNWAGQLGDGTATNRLRPVQILTGVAAVGGGYEHTLVIKTDDSLWAWGRNDNGQLGDGTYTNQLSPVPILTGVAAVAAGAWHSLALKTDGSLWAWGANWFGQLGDGTTTDRARPVQVMTGVAAVAASNYDHTLALKTDGSLWAWGDNCCGQLGDGTRESRARPLPVLPFGSTVDFAVTNAVLTPSNPTGNGTFSVAVTVTNQGTMSGDGGYIDLWTDQPTEQTCPAMGDAYTRVGVLAAGASKTFTFSGLSPGVLGTKTLRVFVDSFCEAGKADEFNNQYTKAYTVVAPTPDFAVTDIVLTPSGPSANATFSAAVTVTNRGTAAEAPGTLQVWADQAAAPDCGAAGDQAAILPSLAAGESQTVTVSGLSAGAGGAKRLLAFVDSACEATESDETNNQSAATYTVTPRPDFAVTSVVLTPSNPAVNATFSAAVTVTNRGAAAGSPGTLQVWADQPAAPDCAAVGSKFVTLASNFAPGASQTVTLSGLPAGAAGAKTLRAFVDSACLSAEADDTNNQAIRTYTVAAPAPDFVVSALALTPSGPLANATFSAAVTVKNQGSAAGIPKALQVWVNQADAPGCAAVGTKSATLTSLAAGASRTVTLTGLPAGAAGAKTLRAFVDSACLSAEADDSNNQTTRVYNVLPTPTPDFAVTGIVLTPVSPKANGTFSAAITVKNQGAGSGSGGDLNVWTDQPIDQPCLAAGNAHASVGTLAAGASKTIRVTGLPAGAGGVKTLRAFVDSACLTAEADDTGNQATLSYTVLPTPTPDFAVTNIVLKPLSPKANGTFTAAITVKNQGTGSGSGGYLDVWTNQPTDQTCLADGDAYVSVGTLAAGASKVVNVTGLRAYAAGTKTLRAFVDSACQAAESAEGNNQLVKGYSVVP